MSGRRTWKPVIVPRGFVTTRAAQFVIDEQSFRFVGANAAIIYGDSERSSMPEVLRAIRRSGTSVVRVWAHGEWDEQSAGRAPNDWLKEHPFRRSATDWNEEAFEHLDRVLAEAASQDLRVQLCLSNWWRDTGGVVQYLNWAGVDATDEANPFGIDFEKAMQFYTNERARELYREHVRRIVTRRNTVTGKLYKDDATIFAYELMNEANAARGREHERRRWIAEMSSFIKSFDTNHLVTAGTWGYRLASERREWIADCRLPNVDFCDVHLYPADDADSFVDSPTALNHFIENRVAAALEVDKPLTLGEFNVPREGFNKTSQIDWLKSYFDSAARNGVGGASLWIWTTDDARQYAITPASERDANLRAVINDGAREFQVLENLAPPAQVLDANRYLVPHQQELTRDDDDAVKAKPHVQTKTDGATLLSWLPQQWTRVKFEKLDDGANYVWGAGVGFIEYVAPLSVLPRDVELLTIRAWLQPVIPPDAAGRITTSRVTLFVNNISCGSRLIEEAKPPFARKNLMQEWKIVAARALANSKGKLTLRFEVEATTNAPHGLNISNLPDGFQADAGAPITVEIR